MATALITGASGGIGLELARVFARHGHDLVLVARTAGKLEALAQELQARHGITALVVAKDLGLPAAPEEIFGEMQQRNIRIDFLVNNAGFGGSGPFVQTDWAREAEMIQLNVVALTHLTKLFSRMMVAQGRGRILNVASTAAFQPGPFMAVYFATKAFVLSFSEAVASELQGTGVTVTALCPGPTKTNFAAAAAMEHSRLFRGPQVATAAEVAGYGFRALMAGRQVAIPGLLNQIMASSVQLVPRSWVNRITRLLTQKASRQAG